MVVQKRRLVYYRSTVVSNWITRGILAILVVLLLLVKCFGTVASDVIADGPTRFRSVWAINKLKPSALEKSVQHANVPWPRRNKAVVILTRISGKKMIKQLFCTRTCV